MSPCIVSFTRLAHGEGLADPAYQSAGAAGFDLQAAVDAPLTLAAGHRAVIPTGLAMAIPPGFEGQVRPRSGLAAKHGITVLNTPGTIDSDYRGEIGVILLNTSADDFTITRGARIAQLVIAPVTTASLNRVTTLDASARGDGGFGSTGV